jgi:hypothetical protein
MGLFSSKTCYVMIEGKNKNTGKVEITEAFEYEGTVMGGSPRINEEIKKLDKKYPGFEWEWCVSKE